MAKLAKKRQTSKGLRFEVVNPNSAGIDVSTKEFQVCVPADRDGDCNQTFGVYTEDLHLISEWLKACRIETVSMESTGVYWLPIFRILKEGGFDVILVNASDVKNYSGKKTDASDAEGSCCYIVMGYSNLVSNHKKSHVHCAILFVTVILSSALLVVKCYIYRKQ